MLTVNNGSLLSVQRHVGNLHMDSSHFHELYEFYYLKCGSVTYLANDKIHHLTAGDVVVIPPNTLHKTVSARDVQRERILVYLDTRLVGELFDTDVYDFISLERCVSTRISVGGTTVSSVMMQIEHIKEFLDNV